MELAFRWNILVDDSPLSKWPGRLESSIQIASTVLHFSIPIRFPCARWITPTKLTPCQRVKAGWRCTRPASLHAPSPTPGPGPALHRLGRRVDRLRRARQPIGSSLVPRPVPRARGRTPGAPTPMRAPLKVRRPCIWLPGGPGTPPSSRRCSRPARIPRPAMVPAYRMYIDRDRGAPHGAAPPTPPGIRVRTTAVRPD